LIENQFKLYGISDSPTQLFDLSIDPQERNDIATEEPALFNRLLSEYTDWIVTIQTSQSGKDY